MASPKPEPPRPRWACLYGSKMRGRSGAGMPMPVSSTAISSSGPRSVRPTVTAPPWGVNLTALPARLTKTRSNWSSSPCSAKSVPLDALRHAIEGPGQLSDLVTARHGKRLGEGTVGQLGRGDREPAERAREVHGQEARGSERCGQAREERSEHGIPGVPLELPSLALGLFERAVGGAQHPIEVGLGAVDREAPLGVESGSHRGQAAIGREGNQRFL